jgi:F-box-like
MIGFLVNWQCGLLTISIYSAVEVLTHILSYLSPSSLSSVALVSRRFYSLVTTPHAWRIAFSRFFPGPDASPVLFDGVLARCGTLSEGGSNSLDDEVYLGHRVFTRLTGLASWRSEYILRTRLLRSLARGKPAEGTGDSPLLRSSSNHNTPSVVTYNSQLGSPVNHLHANFGTGPSLRYPRFMHGADDVGSASTSNLHVGKLENWGLSDAKTFVQFDALDPGGTPWGLGLGDVVTVPNVMDLSQPFGMAYGEGYPGGRVYFRSSEEMRGRYLTASVESPAPELGIPKITSLFESVCSVWIAKSSNVRLVTGGLVDILAGSSCGILTAYSFGGNGVSDPRMGRGEVTCRWVLSPGVPIISIQVDDSYNVKRRTQGRMWAVALNALGEVFYLKDVPKRRFSDGSRAMDEEQLLKLAWETGRTVHWSLVEPTRRIARADPYNDMKEDWSYSPRSSWNGMNLTTEQLRAETQDITNFLAFKPMHFRKVCEGWDMRRKFEVDFAGYDENGGGEAVFVFGCALDEGSTADIKRFIRCKNGMVNEDGDSDKDCPSRILPTSQPEGSLFGGITSTDTEWVATLSQPRSPSIPLDLKCDLRANGDMDHWRTTELSLPNLGSVQITSTAVDMSTFALLLASEDPLLDTPSLSAASSPICSPLQQASQQSGPSDIPGQRARFIAAGTATGVVVVWNMRGPVSNTLEMTNTLPPVRIIHTESPQISCLALSALYLVHGGSDGLVQAWDALASDMLPIRTLNSRFSSRARRRLLQAEASLHGVGINLFAAGAICLDPDPTVLRGVVSLGAHLRYWSYSSSAADQYTRRKRRLRRSERGSNNSDRFSGTGRGALAEYIENEKLELVREKEYRKKERERLAGRFGVGLLDSEEEVLAYARMLSEETFRADEERKRSEVEGQNDEIAGSSDGDVWSSETATPEGSAVGWSSALGASSPVAAATSTQTEMDLDMAEAIRLSLLNEPSHGSSSDNALAFPPKNTSLDTFPIRYVTRRSPSSSPSRGTKAAVVAVAGAGDLDLEHALRLSLMESGEKEEFPVLGKDGNPAGAGEKGKGKRRVS